MYASRHLPASVGSRFVEIGLAVKSGRRFK